MKRFKIKSLRISIFDDRKQMGKYAAVTVANRIENLLRSQEEVRIVFAAAPSQNEFFSFLTVQQTIEWDRVIGFHMDEYLDLPGDAPQRFGIYLHDRLFSKVSFQKVNYMQTYNTDIDDEIRRYELLLKEKPIDIVCMGIGENGHIAFNDPPHASFIDLDLVKVVELDLKSRRQQVNDGCFKKIDEVPTHAITVTIPCLISAKYLSIVVPGKKKADAVKRTLEGPVTEKCPATILQNHSDADLYLDKDSSRLLDFSNLNQYEFHPSEI